MTLVQFGLLLLQISIVLSVFAIGLSTSKGSLVSLFSRPWLLIRSLFAIYGVMLILAIVLVKLLHLPYAAATALIGLAVAPMPPVGPKSMMKAGGEAEYASALLAVAGLLSILWIPLAIHWAAIFYGIDVGVPPTAMVTLILITILAPLIIGATLGHRFPAIEARLSSPLSALGGIGTAIAMLSIIIGSWGGLMDQISVDVLVAILLFAVVGMTAGHVLGGPLPEDRTVLALACSIRHPGVIAAIGGLVAPNAGVALIGLLALIVCTLCTLPYVAWRKRASAKESVA